MSSANPPSPRREVPEIVPIVLNQLTRLRAENEITADKEIAVYPYSDHNCPRGHTERQLAHLSAHFPAKLTLTS